MQLLTATRQGQGERPGDFCFCTEGELVLLGFVCARDRDDPDGGCGCGRAFSGMSSHRATTTAVVRDVDVTGDDLRIAVEAHYLASGLGAEVIGDAENAELVQETISELVAVGGRWPVGTIVGRRLDHLLTR